VVFPLRRGCSGRLTPSLPLGSQVLEGDANGSERSALRREVETELLAADRKIAGLNAELAELKTNPGARWPS
jgi:hypothetical protein